MTRTLTIVLLCLGLNSANAAERLPNEPKPTPAVQLPARIQAACANAKGEFAYVCAEYAHLYAERERAKKEAEAMRIHAEERLKKLTRGGVIENLE